MIAPQRYDLCVVGAGTAGYNAAVQARELGHSVVLVDGKGDLAGLCILRGCMPAKTVLHAADIAHDAAIAPELGVHTRDVAIDPAKLVSRKRHLVEEFKDDRISGIEQFPLIRGQPRFTGAQTLDVDGTVVEARKFIIATGSTVEPPAIPGLREAGFFTSDQALEMTTVPRRIVAVGGGPVGCEFAQYFARLGAQVTLLQDFPTLLRAEDADVADVIASTLTAEGIDVVCDARVENIERSGDERVVTVRAGGSKKRYAADAIFLATGRRPNVDGFDLERAGIAYDRTGIRHDDCLRTSNPAIFAAGDVLGRRCLVHAAEHGGKLAAKNAFCDEPIPMPFDLFDTHSVYTQPEVAVAGISERVAAARGIAYETASYPFSEHGKALTINMPDGFVKVICARDDGTILGVAFVGEGAVDLIHEATVLLHYRAKVSDVLNMPHLHPTMGEIITYPCEELTKRLDVAGAVVAAV